MFATTTKVNKKFAFVKQTPFFHAKLSMSIIAAWSRNGVLVIGKLLAIPLVVRPSIQLPSSLVARNRQPTLSKLSCTHLGQKKECVLPPHPPSQAKKLLPAIMFCVQTNPHRCMKPLFTCWLVGFNEGKER
jgi:hypothetical protein